MVKSPSQIRPLRVTMTGWLTILFGVVNLWRAAGLGRQRDLLLELNASVNPGLLLFVAIVWAGLFLGAAALLWWRRPLMRLVIPALFLLYALYQLGLLLLVVKAPVAQRGWPASVLLYVLILLFTSWALNRPAVRPYFETRLKTG